MSDEALKIIEMVASLDYRRGHDVQAVIQIAQSYLAAFTSPNVNQTGAEAIEIGDIVQFFAASHPLNKPTEYIGRVERDYKGLHAANRYLPITGVRIIEKGTKHESNN